MPSATQDKELVALEKRYWNALRDRDAAAAMQLTDFPCVVSGAQGVHIVDPTHFEAMMKDTRYAMKGFELSDVQVRMVKDDVAIVAYKVHEELDVEGKPVSFDAADSSTWIRRDGRWVCAAHAETILGDPFGRDRRAS